MKTSAKRFGLAVGP